VLFTGSGSTGASNKLCALMRLLPQWSQLPVVVVSSLEHHSNLLPWRESGATILTVGQLFSVRFDHILLNRTMRSFPLYYYRAYCGLQLRHLTPASTSCISPNSFSLLAT
jgi:hypothetical protein